jgi:hypothetical protein
MDHREKTDDGRWTITDGLMLMDSNHSIMNGARAFIPLSRDDEYPAACRAVIYWMDLSANLFSTMVYGPRSMVGFQSCKSCPLVSGVARPVRFSDILWAFEFTKPQGFLTLSPVGFSKT